MTKHLNGMVSNMDRPRRVKLAAVQMAPVFLDKQASTEKVCNLIREAGSQGANVVGFPETIIPGYCAWGGFLPPGGPKAQELCKRLFLNSVEVPGPETDQISQACKDAGVYAVVGINERKAGTTGTMWNTQLIFGPTGELLNKHQKYVPTVTERLVHAPGTTGCVASTKDTFFGTLSGLICGENSNPLATYSLSLEYPVVHVASWPSQFGPDMVMGSCILNATRGLSYALKTFVINSVALMDEVQIEEYGTGEGSPFKEYLEFEHHDGEARATILAPSGKVLAQAEGRMEGIICVEADMEDLILPKLVHDFAGHYNRPELFAHHFETYIDRKSA